MQIDQRICRNNIFCNHLLERKIKPLVHEETLTFNCRTTRKWGKDREIQHEWERVSKVDHSMHKEAINKRSCITEFETLEIRSSCLVKMETIQDMPVTEAKCSNANWSTHVMLDIHAIRIESRLSTYTHTIY